MPEPSVKNCLCRYRGSFDRRRKAAPNKATDRKIIMNAEVCSKMTDVNRAMKMIGIPDRMNIFAGKFRNDIGSVFMWANGLKLSDRGWPSQGRNSEPAPRPASVRWSAWLGPCLQSGRSRSA